MTHPGPLPWHDARRAARESFPPLPGRLVPVAGGRPVLFTGPAMLRGLATADAVSVIPPGGCRAGDPVELLPLP